MASDTTYEYAEVTVGFLSRGKGEPPISFMQVRDITGTSTTPHYTDGPLGALNLMGAQGWRLVSEREVSERRMGWIVAALAADGERASLDNYHGAEFLMMREVRD